MQITIRNQRLLRILGFQPSSNPSNMIAGLSIRGWIEIIRYRLAHLGRAEPDLQTAATEHCDRITLSVNREIARLHKLHSNRNAR